MYIAHLRDRECGAGAKLQATRSCQKICAEETYLPRHFALTKVMKNIYGLLN